MRRIHICFLLALLGPSLYAQVDTAGYKALGMAVQKKFAPDKRLIYFNMQFKGDLIKVESTSSDVLKAFIAESANLNQQTLSTVLLPAPSLQGLSYGIANISVANNRSNPQHGAELMTQMLLGTPVRVFKKQGGFYLVQTPIITWHGPMALQSV